jgi:MFS family permease
MVDYASPPQPAGGRRRGLLSSLRYRNYRLFFIGNGLSLIGTWLTSVATSWLVYRLAAAGRWGDPAALLGYVGFAAQIPMFVLASFTGVLSDRWNRRNIMVVTQALAMLQSAALAFLTLRGTIDIPQIIGLVAFQGLINAFDIPARQAFVVEMVEDRADLPNAIALNSTMFNAARLIGPACAGLLIAAVGEGWCFGIDAVSYLAVLAGLLMMRVPSRPAPAVRHHILRELSDGVRYAFGFPPTRAVIGFVAVVSLMGFALPTLMPIFADAFAGPGRGARMLGFLSAAIGVGALGGGVFLASRHTVVGLGRVIAATGAGYGLCLIAFSFVRPLWLAFPVLAGGGFCFMVTMAGSNTVLQTIADDDKRGQRPG